jgi:hypothetical protein
MIALFVDCHVNLVEFQFDDCAQRIGERVAIEA